LHVTVAEYDTEGCMPGLSGISSTITTVAATALDNARDLVLAGVAVKSTSS
jgi:hypothetical protein